MPLGAPKPVAIPFPVKGVDRGQPASIQPELTTFDLRNVRALHLGDRQGGGRRAGTGRAISTQAGTSGNRRINTLHAFQNQRQAGLGDTGEEVIDTIDPDAQAASSDMGAGWAYYNDIGKSGAANTFPVFNAALADIQTSGLIDYQHIENGGIDGIVSTSKTINKVTAVWAAIPDLDNAGFGNDGPDQSIATCGAFIRANFQLTEALYFHAEYVSTAGGAGGGPEFILKLSTSIDTVEADIWTDPAGNREISGATTPLLPAVFTIEELSSTQVRVSFSWPGAGPAGADITLASTDVNTSVINDSDNNRAGPGTFGGTSARLHTLQSFDVTILGTETSAVVAQVSKDDENTVGSDRYFIPDGFTGVNVDSATHTATTSAGPAESAAAQVYPQVDTSSVNLDPGLGSVDAIFFAQTTAPTERLMPAIVWGQQGTSGNAHFVTRIADDFDTFIDIRISVTRETTTNQIEITQITVLRWTDGVDTQLHQTNTQFPRIVFHSDEQLIMVDDGLDPDDGTDATIQLYINNLLVYEQELSAADIGSAAQPLLYDADGQANLRVGGSTGLDGEFVRFVNVGLKAEGGFESDDTSFGEATSYITAFTPTRIQTGRLDVGTLADVSGPVFPDSRVSAANLGRTIYATNKNKSLIIDPIGLTSESWAAAVTAGSLPMGCELVAAYRGAIYLARQSSNESIWYKSRTLDPLDWDFNLTPLTTAPYAGNNAAIGQPADSIIALIPWLDDFLIFGCASSFWMLEGDPGFGGRVINLSRGVGILGPRAWCFDEMGRLFFLGSGGLYMIEAPGSKPQLVSGVKLVGLLDRINTDTTFIHLAYDAFRHYIHIFLTTEAGTDIHVVKDNRQGADGWFLDAFPDDFGPWSIAETRGFQDIDRAFVIGGNDGRIRRPDDSALDDDGTAISWYFDSPPMQPFGNRLESRVMELNAELFAGSGAGTWEWYTADSADEVRSLSSSPEETGSWGGNDSDGNADSGFQEPVGVSARGGAHKLRVKGSSATTSFEFDNASAMIEPSSRRK